MADHMIEVFAGLEPQGVTGLVGVDNNLHKKKKAGKTEMQ